MSETKRATFDPTKLNEQKTPRAERTESTNEAGGRSWDPDDPRFALYKNVINNLLEDTYYQDATELFDDVVEEFIAVMDAGYHEFPLQLATYARHEGGYRDIAQVLLVLSANYGKREPQVSFPSNWDVAYEQSPESGAVHAQRFVAEYTPMIIDRMDEFNTVVSLQLDLFGKPIPRPLRQGIEDALHKKYVVYRENGDDVQRITGIEGDSTIAVEPAFEVLDEGYVFDEYTAAKYAQRGHEVSLHDVINLVRPNPRSDEREEYFGRIVRGELDDEEHEDFEPLRQDRTWEAERSSDLTTELFEIDPFDPPVGTRGVFEVIADREDDEGSFDVDVVLREGTDMGSEIVSKKPVSGGSETITLEVSANLTEADEFRHRLSDMGLMARVRNLRNMLESGLRGEEIFDYDVDQDLRTVSDGFKDRVFGPESTRRVQEHQMFPFRYYQAYKACAHIGGFGRRGSGFEITSDLLDDWSDEWLNRAIDASVENLPDEFESTFTAVDLSGSMNRGVSNNSDLVRAEIATLFGSIVTKYGGDVGAFGDTFETVDVDDQARHDLGSLDLASEIYKLNEHVGNRTNGWKALRWAIRNDEEYDRFVVFTDEQIWDSGFRRNRSMKECWDQYLEEVNPDAHLYMIDLSSYGDLSMPQGYRNVHQISGWNSEVIEFIDKNEKAQDVIADISSIGPGDY